MKQEYCCLALEQVYGNFECPLRYLPHIRQYVLKVQDFYLERIKKLYQEEFPISHCPWCGAELPKNLYDEWHAIIKEQFGFTDYIESEIIDKLPKEFTTDEWWKNRGL